MKKRKVGQLFAQVKTRVLLLSLQSLLMSFVISSCSNRIHVVPETEEPGVPVTIRVASLEQVPFSSFGTKGSAHLSEACTWINYAIYNADGSELAKPQINQKSNDDSFGTLNLKLEEGNYRLVVMAHSSSSNPKLDNLSKIDIPSNSKGRRITDTFLSSSVITVTKGMQPLSINLDRVVARFEIRLVGDSIPGAVTKLEFEMGTGGSFSLNANTGSGVKPTRAYTDKVNVEPGDSVIGVYTFVSEGFSSTRIKVVAKDSLECEYGSWEFADVPITRNRITVYRGALFAEEVINTQASICLNDEWAGADEYVMPE